MQDSPPVPTKVPLFEAAATLREICHRIEDGHDLSDAVLKQLDGEAEQAKGLVADGIERRRYLIEACDNAIASWEKDIEQCKEAISRLKAIKDSVRNKTRDIIQANPDIPYRDKYGKKIYVCQGSPKLDIPFECRGSKSFSNVLDPHAIDLLGIDDKYIKKVTFRALDTERVKGDLLAGVILPWARLKRTPSLKGL